MINADIYHNRLNNKYIEIFKKQDRALIQSNSKKHLPLFARDITATGIKDYICTGYNRFWDTFFTKNLQNELLPVNLSTLNFYEIILPDLPCHLYIDSEVFLANNGNDKLHIEKIHKEFKEEITLFMIKKKYIESERELLIMELDSSNEKKISIHYIFKIIKCNDKDNTNDNAIIVTKMFKNNFHCGEFIHQFEDEMFRKYGSDINRNKFFFNPEKMEKGPGRNDKTPIYDPGVYTTYRVFRTYGCSKFGSVARPLLPLKEKDKREEYINGKRKLMKQEFLNNLIQYVDPMTMTNKDNNNGIVMIECRNRDGTEPTAKGRRMYKSTTTYHNNNTVEEMDESLTVVTNSLKRKSSILDNLSSSSSSSLSASADGNKSISGSNNNSNNNNAIKNNNNSIPNDFIKNNDAIKLIFSEIRKAWSSPNMVLVLHTFNSDAFTLLIKTQNAKICKMKSNSMRQINIQHNGNHIFFIVDLKNPSFKQGCHSKSPSCFDSTLNQHKFSQSFIFENQETIDAIDKMVDEWEKKSKRCKAFAINFSILQKLVMNVNNVIVDDDDDDK